MNNVPMAAVPSNSAQQLESKLQGVAADFRQRRDKAHRAQQLALERLRLANDECIAVQASVAAAEKKLKETTHFASLQQQDCSNLQSHVNHLTNEVRLQHVELMLKRNHLDEQRETVKQQAATRASDLAQLRALVSKRRCLMMQPKQQHRSAAVTANSLVEEFKGDVKERYGPNHWSKWMQQSAATLQEATEEHKRHAVQLGRVFAAYQAMLKDSTGAADGAAIANVTTNNTNPQGSSMQEESTTMEVIRKVLS